MFIYTINTTIDPRGVDLGDQLAYTMQAVEISPTGRDLPYFFNASVRFCQVLPYLLEISLS
jgi:hypothetical protein